MFIVEAEYEDLKVVWSGTMITNGHKPFVVTLQTSEGTYLLEIELQDNKDSEEGLISVGEPTIKNSLGKLIIKNASVPGGTTAPVPLFTLPNSKMVYLHFFLNPTFLENSPVIFHHTWFLSKGVE